MVLVRRVVELEEGKVKSWGIIRFVPLTPSPLVPFEYICVESVLPCIVLQNVNALTNWCQTVHVVTEYQIYKHESQKQSLNAKWERITFQKQIHNEDIEKVSHSYLHAIRNHHFLQIHTTPFMSRQMPRSPKSTRINSILLSEGSIRSIAMRTNKLPRHNLGRINLSSGHPPSNVNSLLSLL